MVSSSTRVPRPELLVDSAGNAPAPDASTVAPAGTLVPSARTFWNFTLASPKKPSNSKVFTWSTRYDMPTSQLCPGHGPPVNSTTPEACWVWVSLPLVSVTVPVTSQRVRCPNTPATSGSGTGVGGSDEAARHTGGLLNTLVAVFTGGVANGLKLLQSVASTFSWQGSLHSKAKVDEPETALQRQSMALATHAFESWSTFTSTRAEQSCCRTAWRLAGSGAVPPRTGLSLSG